MGKESLEVYINMIYTNHRDESIGSLVSKTTRDLGLSELFIKHNIQACNLTYRTSCRLSNCMLLAQTIEIGGIIGLHRRLGKVGIY